MQYMYRLERFPTLADVEELVAKNLRVSMPVTEGSLLFPKETNPRRDFCFAQLESNDFKSKLFIALGTYLVDFAVEWGTDPETGEDEFLIIWSTDG